MRPTNRLKSQHLLWRAAFGPSVALSAELDEVSPKKLWKSLSATSLQNPEKINVASDGTTVVMEAFRAKGQLKKLSIQQKRTIQKQYREDLKNLNLRWMDQMVHSQAQFREKMSLFWHGHFACRVVNIFQQQQLLDIVRTGAIGKFGDLLRAVSKSPAMLQFLNNQQNKKQHPNENFAREVMELFTMGSGHYTENDVKEAARSFTGWGFSQDGEFVFRATQHDVDNKFFLGNTGNYNGDDIIDILLKQKQTAYFIAKKIYRYFVNEMVDEKIVGWLADRFYKSDYDILQLMENIFTSDWFYDEKNIGTTIKSPVSLLVGIQRMLPLEFDNNATPLLFQRALGQVLFYPPNVAGWPGGKNWINSSTLMIRMRIPQMITANEPINIRPKNDDDVMMGQMAGQLPAKSRRKSSYGLKYSAAEVDWKIPVAVFEKVARENLLITVADRLLQNPSRVSVNVMGKYLDAESRESYIKTAMIFLMGTPEYQLC